MARKVLNAPDAPRAPRTCTRAARGCIQIWSTWPGCMRGAPRAARGRVLLHRGGRAKPSPDPQWRSNQQIRVPGVDLALGGPPWQARSIWAARLKRPLTAETDARNAIKERNKRWKMVVEQHEGIGSPQCDNISETRAGTPRQH